MQSSKNTKDFLSAIYRITTADKTFGEYTNSLKEISIENRELFLTTLLECYAAGEIDKHLASYIEHALDPEPEEDHFVGVDQNEELWQDLVRFNAKNDWVENKVRELNKVIEDAQKRQVIFLQASGQFQSTPNCLPFKKASSYEQFLGFRQELIDKKMIGEATTVVNLRQIFGLDISYKVTNPTKYSAPIRWTGTDRELRSLIHRLVRMNLIDLRKGKGKWAEVVRCFVQANGEKFTIEHIKRSRASKKRQAEIERALTHVCKHFNINVPN